MREHDIVRRLRDLRQLREERAKEAALRQERVVQRAADESRAAAKAVALHLETMAQEEAATFSDLLVGSANAQTLRRIQGRFEKAADDEAHLRHAHDEARTVEEAERRVLEEARQDHRLRHRSAEKLNNFFNRLKSRDQRRRLAIDELAAEEDAGLKRGPSVEPNSRKA